MIKSRKWKMAGVLSVFLAACGPQKGPAGYLVMGEEGELEETSSLALTFDEAGYEHNVPPDILKALAFVETRFERAEGEVEFEGQPAPYGLFNLRATQLQRASELLSESPDDIAHDDTLGILAAAVLLSSLADEAGIEDSRRPEPSVWLPALRKWGALEDEEMRTEFAQDVMRAVASGLAIPMVDGTTILVRKHTIDEEFGVSAQGLRAGGTVWRPSPNNSSRNGTSVDAVIIHTCEGSYSGCVSWLRQSRARVSAHYVVKEDGSEISQLVDETRKAWHIGARYRPHLNDGKLSSRSGQSSNNFTIGIEHGGSARQRSFPQGQIDASVELVRGIVQRHNIPADRYHIIGHGQLQPETRNDPGPNWPWTTYLRRIAQGNAPQPTPAPSNPNPAPSNPNPAPAPVPPSSVSNVITVDNTTPGRFSASSNWNRSAYASGRVGGDYRYRRAVYRSDTAKYKVNIPQTGRYEVFARVPGNGYNTAVPYVIDHAGGRTVVRKNIRTKGATWLSLGTYQFNRKDDWIVQISAWTNGSGLLVADAMRFVRR